MAYGEGVETTTKSSYKKIFVEGMISIPAAAFGAFLGGGVFFLAMNDQFAEGLQFGVATFMALQALYWANSLSAYFLEKIEPFLEGLSLKNLINFGFNILNIILRSLTATGALLLVNSEMTPQKEAAALLEDFKALPLFIFAILSLKTLAEKWSVGEYAKKFNALFMELMAIMAGGIVLGATEDALHGGGSTFLRKFFILATAFTSATAANFLAVGSLRATWDSLFASYFVANDSGYHRVLAPEDFEDLIINTDPRDEAQEEQVHEQEIRTFSTLPPVADDAAEKAALLDEGEGVIPTPPASPSKSPRTWEDIGLPPPADIGLDAQTREV